MNGRSATKGYALRVAGLLLTFLFPLTFLSVAVADIWKNGFESILLQFAVGIASLIFLARLTAVAIAKIDDALLAMEGMAKAYRKRREMNRRPVTADPLPPYAAAVMA